MRSLLLPVLMLFSVLAQAAPTLELSISSSVSSVAAGTQFSYILTYTCTSITENCLGVIVTDVLPTTPLSTTSSNVALVGSVHTTATSYTQATRTAKWTFQSSLPAGSTGQLTLRVLFPLGTTPDGTQATNGTATMTATNATTATATPATVTATAVNNWTLAKTRVSGGTSGATNGGSLDQDVFYQLQFCPNSGQLNLTNIALIDTLPSGASFVAASDSGTYADGVVSWPSFNLAVPSNGTDCSIRTVTIRYPASAFSVGTNNVTNTASATATPVGASQVTLNASLTHSLVAAATGRSFTKQRSIASTGVGQSLTYYFDTANTGTVALANAVIEDAIPAQVDVTQITSGTSNVNVPVTLAVDYQTNLNSNWRTVALTGFNSPITLSSNGGSSTVYSVNVYSTAATPTLGLVAGTEWITRLRYTYASLPPGFKSLGTSVSSSFNNSRTATKSANAVSPSFVATLLATDRNGAAVNVSDTIRNTGTFNATYNSTPLTPASSNADITVANTNPVPRIDKALVGATSGIPGDTMTYEISILNVNGAGGPLSNPVVGDFLDSNLTYIANSATVSTRPSGMPDPTVEVLTNYKNTGRTLLRWRWEGAAAYDLPANTTAKVRFQAKIKTGTPTGPLVNVANLLGQANPAITSGSCRTKPADTNDLNDNGDTAELLCSSNTSSSPNGNITVTASAAMESVKWVKGQLDAAYHKYPDSGLTVAGGSLLYRLQVSNVGNVPMKNVQVVDILPFVGDTGVLDTQNRLSAWRPNLIAPVQAPAGVVVYYSTASNPCRPELNFSPAGCVSANWSVTPPDDMTSVQSLKFDFGAIVMNPLDVLELNWPMRAPIGAPTNGEIAWNSFGYVAVRTDTLAALQSEPIKVGVAIQAPEPANYGHYVWVDENGNGLQDEPAAKGLNGVRVDFYRGDGTLLDSSLTTDDANGDPGYYQFTNNPAGSYYTVFYPPAGYAVTQKNAGTDAALDSDVDPATNRTPTTTLVAGQIDYTWDMGLTVSTTASVGDYVWFDRNLDGIQNEATNDGVNGVTVKIYVSGNPSTPYATTTTSDDVNGNPGYYRFDGLPVGAYFVEFVKPSGASFTTQTAASSSAQNDSDPDLSSGKTATFHVIAGQYDATHDAGLVMPTGSLSLGDRVWRDHNNNGIYEPFGGDAGVNGVRLNLYRDTDGDGAFTPGIDQYYSAATTFTSGGEPGFYQFTNLPAGDFIVQVAPANFLSSAALANLISTRGNGVPAPDPDNNLDNDDNGDELTNYGVVSKAITLTAGAEPANSGNYNPTLDFGFSVPPAKLGDKVWLDTNNNGIQDSGETTGVAGVTVTLYDSNGTQVGTPTTTDSNGLYSFTELSAGTYTVCFTLPSGYSRSPTNQGTDDAKDSDAAQADGCTGNYSLVSGDDNQTVDAGIYPALGSLGDRVWHDINHDGVQDIGETGLNGVTVFIDSNTDGDLDSGEPQTVTSGDGGYLFDNLSAGSYRVRILGSSLPSGMTATYDLDNITSPDVAQVALSAGQHRTDVDFGYYQPLDFGDLPDSYATLLASNGARHIIGGIYLGASTPDDEADGQPSANADGDDSHGSDDEEGVTFPSLVAGQSANLTVSASASGVLNAWADWNRDGDFADANERLFTDQALTAGTNSLAVTVPAGVTAGNNAFRFRATPSSGQGGDSVTGLATAGEVEDYLVAVSAAPPSPPALRIRKTVSTAKPTVGLPYTYTLTITNSGGPTTSPVQVIDTPAAGIKLIGVSLPGGWSCTPTPTLEVPLQGGSGRTLVCDYSGALANGTQTLTLTAVPTAVSGSQRNIATITGDDDPPDTTNCTGSEPVNCGKVTVYPKSPRLELVKQVTLTPANELNTPDGLAQAGEKLTYTFTLTNRGNYPLKPILLLDDQLDSGSLDCGSTPTTAQGKPFSLVENDANNTLAVADSILCTGTHIVTSDEATAGRIENIATALGKMPDGVAVPSTATGFWDNLPPADQISLTKTAVHHDADGDYAFDQGETVTYRFIVRNVGKRAIHSLAVTDAAVGTIACLTTDLAPGADTVCTAADYILGVDDVTAGRVANTATATAQDPDNQPVADTDTRVLNSRQPAGLALKKTAVVKTNLGDPGLTAGDILTYTLVATNTGAVALTNVRISDIKAGAALKTKCAPAQGSSLAPGEQMVCTVNHTLQSGEASPVDNMAHATGKPVGRLALIDAASDYVVPAQLTPSLYTLAGRVWLDTDNDGQLVATETGIDTVSVRLLRCDAAGANCVPAQQADASDFPDQVTAGGGYYQFQGVPVNTASQSYRVRVLPVNFTADLTGTQALYGAVSSYVDDSSIFPWTAARDQGLGTTANATVGIQSRALSLMGLGATVYRDIDFGFVKKSVAAPPDLVVVNSANVASVAPGGSLSYTLEAINAVGSGNLLKNPTVIFTLPTGITVNGVDTTLAATQWACTVASGRQKLTCTYRGSLPVGGGGDIGAPIVVPVTVAPGMSLGPVGATATITKLVGEPDYLNNAATATVTVGLP